MLAIESLTVGYGAGTVLSGIDVTASAGQVACLVGRNGAGKTTLLKTIMGLLTPKAGRLLIDGADMARWPPYRRARAGIGYVPQGRMIFPQLTVYENLLIGLEAAPPNGPSAIEEMYELFPKLKSLATRGAGKLSGGEQQQLAIARALVSRPKVLLLDEPTEGIQPSVVDEIASALARIRDRGDVAILLAEQFLDFAHGLADYFYVLEGGIVASQGHADTLHREEMNDFLSV
jgi:urea transport system ATP-binding protein